MAPLLAIALFSPSGDAAPASPQQPPQRWTAETPEKMIDRAKTRATSENATEREILASVAIIADLASAASHGSAVAALIEIAATPAPTASAPKEARTEAAVIARMLSDDEGTTTGTGFDTALGIVTSTSIIGPFRDTGGGLARREGPEAKDEKFSNAAANYSWGSVDVHWRAATSDAEGIPLDLWIEPRKESCSIIAATVKLDKETTFVVRLAATGSARLSIDGVDAGSSEEANSSALFERLAARADRAAAGSHLISAKVCTGALADDGRARLRITDEKGDALHLQTTSALVEPAPKTHVVKILTPLARALVSKGDIDTQIAATIIRTLAGADDDRSPRAPGLLDSIEHALKPDDVDRLAVAGWLAPSGANRSGWLNDARNRAEKSGDHETVAFCTRRLAASRLNAKMADWAQSTIANGISAAKDDEAVTLRADVKVALNTEALRIDGLHELEAAADAEQDKASDDLLEALARVASSLDPARESWARLKLAKRGEKDNAYIASIRDSKQAVLAANDAFASGLDDSDEAVDIVSTVLANGEAKAARGLISPLISLAPNRADVWTVVADTLAALPRNAKEEAQMRGALQRARDLAPGDARTKGVMTLLEKDKTTEAGDEHYLVPEQTLLAQRKGAPAPGTAPDVADRELYWLRAVVMHKDKRVSQLIQYAREIVIAPRTQDELVEDLPAEGDLTEILRARVHRKSGGTAFPVEEHDEGSRPRVKWPDLQPGDVVEVAIRTWTAAAVGGRGDPPFYFIDYAGAPSTHPLLYNEVDIETPKDHPLFVDVLHGAPDKKEEKDVGATHIVRLVWNAPKIVAEEPLSPAMSEIVPVILGSTFQTWNDFRAWYTEAVRGFTEPDDEVRRLAAELTKGKNTREDKVRAIFNFVSDDIRYVNYVSGEWWLPNRPQQLLARREGDCDDKAMLLITLLKSIGINA
ncbi:MAG: transglutaminase-like domain-containing protein, partial [Polyangiaceae bacterium]